MQLEWPPGAPDAKTSRLQVILYDENRANSQEWERQHEDDKNKQAYKYWRFGATGAQWTGHTWFQSHPVIPDYVKGKGKGKGKGDKGKGKIRWGKGDKGFNHKGLMIYDKGKGHDHGAGYKGKGDDQGKGKGDDEGGGYKGKAHDQGKGKGDDENALVAWGSQDTTPRGDDDAPQYDGVQKH